MRAIVIREPGGPEKLEVVADQPVAEPAAGQVRVRVAACGVCYRDIVDRLGKYPFMRRPIVTGHEWAGVIDAIGANVSDYAIGDRVAATHRAPCGTCRECVSGNEIRCEGSPIMYGLTVDGGYAESVIAWPSSLVKVPAEVPLDAASFLHCTAAVALRALAVQGRLQAGEKVLITGASGGVGIHAIQVAKLLGAEVIAFTGNEHKADALRAVGADEVIVAAPDAFHKQLAARGGVDLALDLVGVPTINAALRSLRVGGRCVVVGNVTQERVEVNPGYLIMRELTLTGSALATRDDLRRVFGWVVDGKLKPMITARLKLEDAAAAQIALGERGVTGRQVLIP